MRKNKILKIELLSDLCVSDGSVFNSTVDIDICRDPLGFPYIPAKRIKGCLRECAQELQDWGCWKKDGSDIVKKIFGDGGNGIENAGSLSIGNARLRGYDSLVKEVQSGRDSAIYHKQNVTEQYSYLRTQTGIERETGIADEHSLRTIRVVKKGLCFEAELSIGEEYETQLQHCVSVFTNMGIARTRGLGEIKAELSDPDPIDRSNGIVNHKESQTDPEASKKKAYSSNGQNANWRLPYSITLEEPVITLSASGNQEKARDYLEGSTIFGVLLSCCVTDEEKKRLLNAKGLRVSNAYLQVDGKRLTEVPAYISAVKDRDTEYRNRLYYEIGSEPELQINPMKHRYVELDNADGILYKANVTLEERYHHRRPDDKSIGRASSREDGNSDFYQISSISEGQTFGGFIEGAPEVIQLCEVLLKRDERCRIGYGRSAEYGLCKIIPESGYELQQPKTNVRTKHLVVDLVSPAIVYSDRAMYSVSAKDLIEEVLYSLLEFLDVGNSEKSPENSDGTRTPIGKIDDTKTKRYIKYVSVGGYNVTWNRRKPSITAFDKGTALDIYFIDEELITLPDHFFIGERTREGYGECRVWIPEQNNTDRGEVRKAGIEDCSSSGELDLSNHSLGNAIAKKLFIEFIKSKAIEDVFRRAPEKKNDSLKAVVSNMMLMIKENSAFDVVKSNAKERFIKDKKDSSTEIDEAQLSSKEIKWKNANELIHAAENNSCEILKKFIKRYKIKGFVMDQKQIQYEYLKQYLIELKYKMRMEGVTRNGE